MRLKSAQPARRGSFPELDGGNKHAMVVGEPTVLLRWELTLESCTSAFSAPRCFFFAVLVVRKPSLCGASEKMVFSGAPASRLDYRLTSRRSLLFNVGNLRIKTKLATAPGLGGKTALALQRDRYPPIDIAWQVRRRDGTRFPADHGSRCRR